MATLIVDGHYLLHRVLHVPHLRVLATKDGKPSGGAFGFIKSLRSSLREFPEVTKVVAVFDGGRSKRRMELHPGYKDRPKKDDEDEDGIPYWKKFNMNFNYLKFILPRLGVSVVKLKGREADDLIYLLCKHLDSKLKIVASDDKDMYQLVDSDVHVWRPIAEDRVALDNLEDYAGVKKEHLLFKKAILGDPSDRIPKVKGVGPKTVDDMLYECGDIGPYPHEKFFEYALELNTKRSMSLVTELDRILTNLKLVDMSLEEFSDEEVSEVVAAAKQRSEFDVLAVKRLFVGLEYFSLIEDFSRWVTVFQTLK